jgi:hypothetical protein
MLSKLKHENIIGFEEAFFTNIDEKRMQLNIITELVEGGNLFKQNQNPDMRLGYDDLKKAFF